MQHFQFCKRLLTLSLLLGMTALLVGRPAMVDAQAGNPNAYGSDANAPNDAVFVATGAGNVGIGTTNPQRPLHVKGNTELVALEGTTHAYIAWYPDGPVTRQAFVGFGTSSNDDFTIANENVGDILLLPTSGNVGIGTTDPQRPLHVKGNTELVALEGTTHAYIAWYPDGPVTRQAFVGFGTSSNDDFTIANENVGDILLLPTSGNVGIGTTDPQRPLHVKGNTELVALEGTTHAYIAWYPDGPATRQAFVGFGASSNDDFTIANENVGDILLLPTSGNVGIGTTNPQRPLHVKGNTELVALEGTTHAYIAWYPDGSATRQAFVGFGSPSNNDFTIENENVGANILLQTATGGYVGIQSRNKTSVMQFHRESSAAAQASIGFQSGNDDNLTFLNDIAGGDIVLLPSYSNGGSGGSVSIGLLGGPTADLDVNGTTSARVIQITGGDLAEPFAIADSETVQPGMVVAIDPDNPGQMRLATAAYDRTVAGVISGAGGIEAGVLMYKDGATPGSHPVALTGRVYVYADASNGAIVPGDLLTTSTVPGHAMKVTDHDRAQGAILGKAMSKLEQGTGLVLVLVTLQ